MEDQRILPLQVLDISYISARVQSYVQMECKMKYENVAMYIKRLACTAYEGDGVRKVTYARLLLNIYLLYCVICLLNILIYMFDGTE